MRLIGICGYLGAGKSVAAVTCELHGYEVHPMAQILKDMLRTLGLEEDQVRGDRKMERDTEILGGKTPRWAMQSLGTDWGREMICDDIWLRAWWQRVRDLPAVVCDDVRFPNEAEFIRSKGGRIVQINRTGCGPGKHASERLAFGADYTLLNDGTFEELDVAMGHALNILS